MSQHRQVDPNELMTVSPDSALDRARVFVYGTLQPGECNYDYCASAVVEKQPAIVYGQLFDLPLGYPALTPGDAVVYGYLLQFADDSILRQLDELEDYVPHRPIEQNEYVRTLIPTFSLERQPLGTAWVYQMTRTQAQGLGGVLLSQGRWTGCC
jgi:gamma-glutamylcyclotransferase (GGCT)/AIG2-like uncharacterized protein YtfP